MVPGLIFRRSGFCDSFVPFICCLEFLIDIHYYSAIVEKAMVYQFTNGEFNLCDIRYSSHVIGNLAVLKQRPASAAKCACSRYFPDSMRSLTILVPFPIYSEPSECHVFDWISLSCLTLSIRLTRATPHKMVNKITPASEP